jgi:tetratricopeptide (TPR) repeat protein
LTRYRLKKHYSRMRVNRPYKPRQFFAPLAFTSVAALLTACHPGGNLDNSRYVLASRNAEMQSDLVFNDAYHGIKWTVPGSFNGKFESNPNYNTVLAIGDVGASFLSIANTGTAEPDAYAIACAVIRGFNIDFPSAGVRKLESTENNGAVWQHYIYEGTNEKGPFQIVFDVTLHERKVVGLVNFTLLRGPQKQPQWKNAEAYKGIAFTTPDAQTKFTKTDANACAAATTRLLLYMSRSYMDRSRPADALPFVNEARIINPGDRAIVEMNADELILTRDYAKILPELNILCSLFPDDSALVWRHAFVLGEMGNKAEALKEYARAIHEMGNVNEDALNAYLSYLDNIHELGSRLDEVVALCNQCGDPSIQLYMARACLDSGDKTRAGKIIEDLVAKCEAYPQLAEPLISLYLDMENYDEALRISELVIKQGNPAGHYLAAATLMREGRFKEARAHIILSLEKLPNNRNVKDLSDAINAQLGKADTSTFQMPIEAIPLPVEFKTLVPAAPNGFEEGFGAHNEYQGVLYDFTKNKQLRTTLYGRFHVGTVSALRKMNDLRFPFDPLYERVYVNYVRVFGPDGTQIAEGKLADYYTANDSQQSLMSQKKELHIPVPSLSPGCTVEYATSFLTLGNQDKMPFKLRRLSQYNPTQIAFAGIRGDTKGIVYALANGAQELDAQDGATLFFYATFPEPLTMYPDTPPGTMYIPSVWLGSSEKTWAGETKDYYAKAGKLMNPDPIAAERAKQLLGDKYTKADAVRKLTDYVRESLTYQGLAFGVRAMIPNTCEDILRNRYGDCKDHSYLLVQMLRSVGIKAYLALVDTTRGINTAIPDTGQFDHMIVYLPDYNGGWFIDATDKVSSSDYEPFWLADCPSLILDPDNARLVTIPRNPADTSGIDVIRNVRISADGVTQVDEKVTFRGLWAGYMRNILRDKTVSEYAPAIADAVQMQEIASVKNIKAQHLDDLKSDVVLEYSYAPEDGFADVGGTLSGHIPASWEIDSLTLLNDQPVRRVPIWQNHDYKVTADTTITPPEGYKVSVSGSANPVKAVTPFFSFEFGMRADGQSLKIVSRCGKNSGVFPASTRDARESAYSNAMNEIRQPIVLVKQH